MGSAPAVNWEKKLNILTGAASFEREDAHHSRYEATSYPVLERLAQSGFIRREDTVVDYGCGKGRVGFFLNYALGCGAVGVDYNEALYGDALKNLASYSGRDAGKVSFACVPAENYAPGSANCFYFFNPISVKILQAVLRRIFESYYDAPREMRIFFYYALDSYLACLMAEDGLEFAGEIDCRDLFHNDDVREKILVFRIPAPDQMPE